MFKGKFFKGILLPLAIGLICAVISAVLLYQYVQEVQQTQLAQFATQSNPDLDARQNTMPVVVSTQPLQPGMAVNFDDLRVRELDETSLPSDVVHPSEAELLAGRIVRADLAGAVNAGKPIQWLHIQPPAKTGFANTLSAGLVPLSFPVDSLQRHAGLLQPGDILDLYANTYSSAELILERVEVLATGAITGSAHSTQGLGQNSVVADTMQTNRPENYQQITVAVPLADYFKTQQIAENRLLLPILRNTSDPLRLEHIVGLSQVEVITPGNLSAAQQVSQQGGF